jgi:hypothetical protein
MFCTTQTIMEPSGPRHVPTVLRQWWLNRLDPNFGTGFRQFSRNLVHACCRLNGLVVLLWCSVRAKSEYSTTVSTSRRDHIGEYIISLRVPKSLRIGDGPCPDRVRDPFETKEELYSSSSEKLIRTSYSHFLISERTRMEKVWLVHSIRFKKR